MIKIEVKTAHKDRREVTRKADNKTFVFYEQSAYAFTVDRDGKPRDYPESIKLSLENDQEPYAPGLYTLTPDALYVDRNGHLQLGRFKLKNIQPVQNARAA